MARLLSNVPFFRPARDAVLSELPDASSGVAAVDDRTDRTAWHESGAGGWHESSHDLRAGASVSEWNSFDEIDRLLASV